MAISFLPVSDHRFKKSPFFACNDRPETRYGIYNERLYPISSNYDEVAHYQHLKTFACLYDVPETPLRITGKDAAAFLQKLFTRNIKKLKVGRAVYALACNHQGGVLMDGVLMRPNDQEFLYVQGNGDFLNWANANLGDLDASISDFNSWVLQVQGPTALDLMTAVTGIDHNAFSYYAVTEAEINGLPCYISRSGWTGERGFEIYSKDDDFNGEALWQYLLCEGAPFQLMASDVTSMHIRRLEAGILDYGTDIDQSLNPFELGLGQFVDLSKDDFIGRRALLETDRRATRVMGLRSHEVRPIRGDCLMNEASDSLGVITAGAWSPSLDCGIGIIRLDRPIDPDVALRLRTETGDFQAELCPLPFYDPQKRIPRL
ncbi:MAG: aminomethyl transferase family protein [Gammaproteobacteria bacterium]|nr:aminomethyl transferase family protein [Gammaproteobacteria bacterium]